MKPRLKLTDKEFRYYDSAHTDVRRTWRKERERLAAERERQTQVVPIKQRSAK